MPDRSNDEILAHYVSVLGQDFGEDFREIENRYTELRLFWRIYRSFFAANQQRVELFNRVSGVTAWALEHALFDQCILKLSRLLDRAQTGRGGRDSNLSFERIQRHISTTQASRFEEFSTLLEEAQSSAEAVRDWRNRQSAHLDLEVAHGRSQLEPLTIRQIELANNKCGEMINWVLGAYFESESALDPYVSLADDELRFLKMLYLGDHEWQRHNQVQLDAIERGENVQFRDVEFPEWLSETYEQLQVRLQSSA